MGLRTADIEKLIIIQIDGETHACLTIHKIFTKGLGLPHTIRLGSGPRMNQGRAKGCVSCFRHDVWQNSEAGHARHRRNRKGANHASSRQYPVDHSWWVGHRNRMGIGGTDSVHLHHRHPVRHSSVQDGGTHLDAVWQNRAIRRRSRLCLGNILWWCWSAAGWRSAIWVQACSTASSIIGIPFGIQSFKMAKLALWPFGAQIYSL